MSSPRLLLYGRPVACDNMTCHHPRDDRQAHDRNRTRRREAVRHPALVSGHYSAILVAAGIGAWLMAEFNGHLVNTREFALITVAGEMVRDWFRDPKRPHFREALLAEGRLRLPEHGLTAADYPMFRLLAHAIRTGQGHPTDNPAPLVAILRPGIHHRE
jgi:hypothetical protein